MYLRAITPVRIFAGGECAGGVDAGVLGGGVLAGLALLLPAQRGPVQRRAARVPPAAGERGRALVPVEPNRFFSPLGETSIVGGIFP